MRCGLDQLFSNDLSKTRSRLRDSRVALLTHAAAVDHQGRNALTVLEELGARPKTLFTPEHGFDLVYQAQAGAEAFTAEDDLCSHSLYGTSKDSLTPTAEQFGDANLLVIDLCDVGSRYYTYVWTALLAARAAASANLHTLILDRPNPLSGDPSLSEGKPQSPEYLSFVGLEPVPIRHGLTLGELVITFLQRDGHGLGADAAASVVPVQGWERHQTAVAWGRPFSPPSPNMPTLETALVYGGGCLLEGTNLSEGRGTTLPFQLVGAPFLDGEKLAAALAELGTPGAQIRPARFKPTFDKHAGQAVSGILVQVTNPRLFRPVATYLSLLSLARQQAPEQFQLNLAPYEFETERCALDLLAGTNSVREALLAGAKPQELMELLCPVPSEWHEEVQAAETLVARASAGG